MGEQWKKFPSNHFFTSGVPQKTNLARHLYLTVNSVWRAEEKHKCKIKKDREKNVQSKTEHAETSGGGAAAAACWGERARSCAGDQAGSQVAQAWDPLKPPNTYNLDLEQLWLQHLAGDRSPSPLFFFFAFTFFSQLDCTLIHTHTRSHTLCLLNLLRFPSGGTQRDAEPSEDANLKERIYPFLN